MSKKKTGREQETEALQALEDHTNSPEYVKEKAFLDAHGYPFGTPGRDWLEGKIDQREQRLFRLSAMKAPDTILESERRLVAQAKGWLAAWDKEHVK